MFIETLNSPQGQNIQNEMEQIKNLVIDSHNETMGFLIHLRGKLDKLIIHNFHNKSHGHYSPTVYDFDQLLLDLIKETINKDFIKATLMLLQYYDKHQNDILNKPINRKGLFKNNITIDLEVLGEQMALNNGLAITVKYKLLLPSMFLIAKGADINTQDMSGQLLLSMAVRSKNPKHVKLLMAKGAPCESEKLFDTDIINLYTPLHLAIHNVIISGRNVAITDNKLLSQKSTNNDKALIAKIKTKLEKDKSENKLCQTILALIAIHVGIEYSKALNNNITRQQKALSFSLKICKKPDRKLTLAEQESINTQSKKALHDIFNSAFEWAPEAFKSTLLQMVKENFPYQIPESTLPMIMSYLKEKLILEDDDNFYQEFMKQLQQSSNSSSDSNSNNEISENVTMLKCH